jgi:hypothetical protein
MASENSGGGKSKVVQNANTREDRVPAKPFTQTLNKYGTPDTNSRPVVKSSESKTKTSSQIAADAQSILDQLALVQKNVNAIVIPEIVIADPVIKVPTNTGGNVANYYVTATPSAPSLLTAIVVASPPPVKTATLDIILFDEESVPIDGMFDQIFENIGGQELISITRSDIVNGQKISYQPIKNLSAIQQRYNPNNILSLQQTADSFFAGFSIKLEDKIPEIGNGTNGHNVYLNATGDLIIEFININPDEQVETQISVSGTIYEADLGDYTS